MRKVAAESQEDPETGSRTKQETGLIFGSQEEQNNKDSLPRAKATEKLRNIPTTW